MGRYSVPQYDHDDDGDNNNDDPMEWEDLVAVNTHNDHHNINNGNGNRNGDGGNINSNNSNLNGIGSQLQDMSMNNINDNHHHSRQSTNGHHGHHEHGDEHDHAPSSTHNNSHTRTSNDIQSQAMVQLMAEQYQCTNINQYQSNVNMMEQEVAKQQKSQKRKRRIVQTLNFAIILVAILSIVLKRYAPPPPPIASVLNLNHMHHDIIYPSTSTLKEVFSSFSADTATDKSHTNNNELEDDDNKVIQHEHEHVQYETWADYSKHVFHLVHYATVYGMSVGWYTISNSFKYAIDEARDWMTFVSNDARDTNVNDVGVFNMNLGIGVKDALISFCNTVRQSLGMQYTIHQNPQNTMVYHRRFLTSNHWIIIVTSKSCFEGDCQES